MKVDRIERYGSWKRVLNAARFTVGKSDINREPSDRFKRRMLLSEHSPIRLIEYDVTWRNAKMWVTVHLTRHSVGCTPFVRTQRADRNELVYDRDSLPQGSDNDMRWSGNAQSIINISRKRLCFKASTETRLMWKEFMCELQSIDPILAEKSVPECVYRGFCPEEDCCGYANTEKYKERLHEYRRVY